MKTDMDYTMGFPMKVYLTFVSTGLDQQPGDFAIETSYIKYDPNAKDSAPAANNVIVV